MTRSQIRCGEERGDWHLVGHDVYRRGSGEPTALDRALGAVVAVDGVASGCLAGVLLGLDGIWLQRDDVTVTPEHAHKRAGVRRRTLAPERITEVKGFRCVTALQALLDLAANTRDDVWEQALESALRMQLTTIAEVESALPEMGRARIPGVRRIRRVLALRPVGAKPTGSILETKMVQLARQIPGLPPPIRQYRVENRHGDFVAFVDLCWPELGIFLELDGAQHKGQPVYDASRETAVSAATGWLVGRFTWTQVHDHPVATMRQLADLVRTARLKLAP